jgi:phosphoenolpyruvate-protein kinase (PTS system EI component)
MTDAPHSSTMIFGEVAAAGAASGPAFVYACAAPVLVPRRTISEDDVPKEMTRFDAAVSEAAQKLLDMQQGIARQAGTLMYGVRDEAHNGALVLKRLLEGRGKRRMTNDIE